MLILFSQSHDPALNLATEEYLLFSQKYSVPLVFIWQNQNTIVIGRNQNSAAEIDLLMVEKDQVQVVRRNTGGGTVFQDLGNLCFSLIIDKSSTTNTDEVFRICLDPVLKCLRTLGLEANFKGRNDLEVQGIKISGNAQLQTNKRVLSHGTLLFDVDLQKINKYLKTNPVKMASKKIQSNQARVMNIKELLNVKMSVEEFKNAIGNSYQEKYGGSELILDAQDWKKIDQLAKDKYRDWTWNYGKNETFTFKNEFYYPEIGLIQINLNTDEGKITKIKFYGDFLGTKGTEELEKNLVGLKYDFLTVKEFLDNVNLEEIFGEKITMEILMKLIFEKEG